MDINTLPNPATDILHPPAYEDGTDKEFRNVGYQEPDAGESPKKEQFTIDIRRKLGNKNHIMLLSQRYYKTNIDTVLFYLIIGVHFGNSVLLQCWKEIGEDSVLHSPFQL
jgi:hypothetical protein